MAVLVYYIPQYIYSTFIYINTFCLFYYYCYYYKTVHVISYNTHLLDVYFVLTHCQGDKLESIHIIYYYHRFLVVLVNKSENDDGIPKCVSITVFCIVWCGWWCFSCCFHHFVHSTLFILNCIHLRFLKILCACIFSFSVLTLHIYCVPIPILISLLLDVLVSCTYI